MYGKLGIVGVTGGLATTGFSTAWYVTLAAALIVTGLLFARWGRRRGATR